jgi:hypothetical protein
VGPARCDAIACAAACPRDAARDASGRCACEEGTLPLLGACVPPSVGDAFCGPAAFLEADGCTFRACVAGQRLDVGSGACVPASLASSPSSGPAGTCTDAGLPVLQASRVVCVASDATCPRGARRSASSVACERAPRCPPGSLPDDGACVADVTAGGRIGDRRVDVGAWAALALGFDGGRGSRELCQPVWQHAVSLGLAGEGAAMSDLRLAIALTVPDQDVSRVRADVRVEAEGQGFSVVPSSSDLERFVSADVATLVEALRGLGGEASAASVDLRLRCPLGP